MARQVFGHWLFSNVESHVDPGFSQLSYFYMVPVSLLIYVSIRVRSYANWRCLRHALAHAKAGLKNMSICCIFKAMPILGPPWNYGGAYILTLPPSRRT